MGLAPKVQVGVLDEGGLAPAVRIDAVQCSCGSYIEASEEGYWVRPGQTYQVKHGDHEVLLRLRQVKDLGEV